MYKSWSYYYRIGQRGLASKTETLPAMRQSCGFVALQTALIIVNSNLIIYVYVLYNNNNNNNNNKSVPLIS